MLRSVSCCMTDWLVLSWNSNYHSRQSFRVKAGWMESRETVTEQIDWQTNQPSHATFVSVDMKCWGTQAADSKARTSHHLSPASRREKRKKKLHSLIRNCSKSNIWEMSERPCWLFRAPEYHLELSWTVLKRSVLSYMKHFRCLPRFYLQLLF